MTYQQSRVIKSYSDVSRYCLSERVRDFSLSTVCCANYKTSKKAITTWVAIAFLNACMNFFSMTNVRSANWVKRHACTVKSFSISMNSTMADWYSLGTPGTHVPRHT